MTADIRVDGAAIAEPRDHKFQEQWEKQIRSDPEVIKDVLGAAFLINTEARRDGTRAVMSHPQLAEYLGVSVSTAQRHIRRLRGLGYLELVERGHRRGNGTVTANVYKLTLRFAVDVPSGVSEGLNALNASAEAEVDPWASPMDDSQHVSQMTDRDPLSTGQPGDLLSGVSTGQNEVSTGQNKVSTGQNKVSTGHLGDRPLFNPSFNPSQIPHVSSPSAGETAVAQSEHEHHQGRGPGSDGFGIGNEMKKQDQKRLEEPTEPRCKTCGVAEPRHHQWTADSGDTHPFNPTNGRKPA